MQSLVPNLEFGTAKFYCSLLQLHITRKKERFSLSLSSQPQNAHAQNEEASVVEEAPKKLLPGGSWVAVGQEQEDAYVTFLEVGRVGMEAGAGFDFSMTQNLFALFGNRFTCAWCDPQFFLLLALVGR